MNRIIVSPDRYFNLSNEQKEFAITIKARNNEVDFISRRRVRKTQSDWPANIWEINIRNGVARCFTDFDNDRRKDFTPEKFLAELNEKYPADYEWFLWNQEIFKGQYSGDFYKPGNSR